MSADALPPEAISLLGEGRQVYVAVSSENGPHVTPELYAWSEGALWFAAAATTLKAKVLQKDPSIGAVVSVPGRALVMTGRVRAFDAHHPVDLARQVDRLPAAARALTRFTVRNATDLLAFAGDLATGKLGWGLPPRRIAFALRPERVALIENDSVTTHWGWGLDDGDLDDADAEAVPVGGERAVAAFPGPVALPCRWFAEESRLHLPGPLTGLLDLPRRFPVSVVVDQYGAPGPAAKQGTLVRGVGTVDRRDPRLVELTPDRVTEWDGIESSTTAAG